MTIEEIIALGDPKKILGLLAVRIYPDVSFDENQKEYDGEHAILDKPKTKEINDGSGAETVRIPRLAVPFQEKIVENAISFVFGNDVKLWVVTEDETEKAAMEYMIKVIKDAKLHYHDRRMMRTLLIETEVAELFYQKELPKDQIGEDGVKYTIRTKLLSNNLGDSLFPHFNDNGDMDAFTRVYQADMIVGGASKKVTKTVIYAADKIYSYAEGVDTALVVEKNPFGKIPIVFYRQKYKEWQKVQILIENYEERISRLAYANDVFGDPLLVTVGDVSSLPNKDNGGKVIQMEYGEDAEGNKNVKPEAKYLMWSETPESQKLELTNNWEIIHNMTSTPDASLDKMKSLGATSGKALKALFVQAILKALNKEEIIGEGYSRRLNLLKVMLGQTNTQYQGVYPNMNINFEFQPAIPEDVTELIENLNLASGGDKIISQQTAVNRNPLVEDATAELEQIRAEDATQAGSQE